MTNTLTSTTICASLAITALIGAPALAEPPSETIETAAYNVSTPQGYTAVSAQIRRAAGRVCGNVDQRNLGLATSWRTCRDTAQADGIRQLDAISRNATVTVIALR